MPIDPNIALGVRPAQFDNPLARYAQMAQLQGVQQQNRLADLQMQAHERAQAEDEATREAYRTAGGDTNALLAQLARAGLYKPYQTVQKAALEATEKKAATAKHEAETKKITADMDDKMLGRLSATMASMLSNPSDENLRASLGNYPSPEAQRHLETLLAVQDPAIRRQLILGHAMQTEPGRKVVELTLPNFKDAGGRLVNVNALAGNVAPIEKTATIGELETGRHNRVTEGMSREQVDLAKKRDAREAASAAQGVTYTTDGDGNLVAVRSRLPEGATSVSPIPVMGPDGKPVPGKGGKPTEWEGKNALFGARAAEAHRLLNDLEAGGTRTPGIIKQGVEGLPLVGGALGMGVNALPGMLGGPSVAQQQVEQAQRDFINAILRLESGAAIGKEEFENARKQYFPQPGEGPEIVAQKRRARETAIAGLQRNAGRFAYDAAPPGAAPGPRPAPAAGGAPGAAPFGLDPAAIDAELARRTGGR
jgi:hypothetical protein